MTAHISSDPRINHPLLTTIVDAYVAETKLSVAQLLLHAEQPSVYKIRNIPTISVGARAPVKRPYPAVIIADRLSARKRELKDETVRAVTASVRDERPTLRRLMASSIDLRADKFSSSSRAHLPHSCSLASGWCSNHPAPGNALIASEGRLYGVYPAMRAAAPD
jgi:hypothetical protein